MLSLSSCASNPRIENLSPSQRAKLNSIQVQQGSTDREHEILDTVTGLSCHRNAYHGTTISDQEALEGIRIRAVQLGADAVINLFCQRNADTDWYNNCWASVKCIGEAIKYK